MIHPTIAKSSIGVVGSGAMGAGIAQVAATAGHRVFIYDTNKSALDKAKDNLDQTLKKLVDKQKVTEEKADTIVKNICFVTDLKEFAPCGMVIEAIVEKLEVKQQVFTQLETIVPDDCILASNTSSLSIASIGAACTRKERVIGIHFFNPAPLMPLVEIIPAVTTGGFFTEQAKTTLDSWGKVTVLTKDTPGFIVNRVARSYYGESIRIYEEGIADFATIDWAMKSVGNFKMGPFELMDFIGHDVNYKVSESVWEQFFYEPRFKPSLTQKRLYEAQLFGRKSGRGFYDYSEGGRQARSGPLVAADDLLQPLELALVVAEDQGDGGTRHPLERAHVAVHRGRRGHAQIERVARLRPQGEPREPVEPRPPIARRQEQRLPPG
ncbi:MAG TPA: 3-hydroxyacyl-CoA dehydrogenase NAD-binding domain-containing protein, partial [Bacteroidia bacterium]|nr:3-hydroxyacyl-CoA dehydrogenase NAD-binding domain-containing protein [Bacteroidia bacterium]